MIFAPIKCCLSQLYHPQRKHSLNVVCKAIKFGNVGYLPKVFIGSDRRGDMHVRVSPEDFKNQTQKFQDIFFVPSSEVTIPSKLTIHIFPI